MAFSGTAGSVIQILVGTSVVTGISEWSLDPSQSLPETTAFGDVWDNEVSSVRTATGSFSGNRDESGGQQFLRLRFENGTKIQLLLYEDATKYYDVQNCYITGESPTINVKGKGEVSFTFTSTGPITYN